ncbi:unnamed protein product [Oikopleura dioica]|uniref:Peptidyl-prolyl cis-trans isomerase n=1 Tax=Oikopleura dioica TaxID=34765 RepID=E4Y4M9_OIKDI|nr:unnamed protein product [Oikopleura dioica]
MEGAGDDIPDGWTAKVSRSSGQAYYVNRFTNESQWEKPTKPAQKPSSEKVQASHLLVKHRDSRRPASWRNDNITISKEEALEQLNKYMVQIESGERSFADLASEVSDCSSAKRGGDLGPFGRGQMQRPFEEATFALKVGEMSGVVDTDSGVHIILRTA